MKIIGLTGGIGSGKSYVANYFSAKNIPVYNSDSRAKILMETNSQIGVALRKEFGNGVFVNQQLNRNLIASEVFNNPTRLAWLNQLIHPAVNNDFQNWCQQQTPQPWVVKEAAILIESGAYKSCDYIIVVVAPKELRIERVMKRDNLSYSDVIKRMNNQLTDEEREKFAHFIINNNGIQVVSEQVEKILEKL